MVNLSSVKTGAKRGLLLLTIQTGHLWLCRVDEYAVTVHHGRIAVILQLLPVKHTTSIKHSQFKPESKSCKRIVPLNTQPTCCKSLLIPPVIHCALV